MSIHGLQSTCNLGHTVYVFEHFISILHGDCIKIPSCSQLVQERVSLEYIENDDPHLFSRLQISEMPQVFIRIDKSMMALAHASLRFQVLKSSNDSVGRSSVIRSSSS